ncbi:MAG: MaoC family dehydratase [Betaproteobacteria bacterium]|nr:MaoC family dehydratase [Betaproteobacteria bacterium]
MSAVFSKTVSEADILAFGGVSGDTQPVHFNQEYASTTMFKGRIAHGMLTASLISGVLGTKLPGPGSIYISQTLRFRAPVRIGETVHAKATVKEVLAEKKRVVIDTVCTVGDKVVLEGEAVMMPTVRK